MENPTIDPSSGETKGPAENAAAFNEGDATNVAPQAENKRDFSVTESEPNEEQPELVVSEKSTETPSEEMDEEKSEQPDHDEQKTSESDEATAVISKENWKNLTAEALVPIYKQLSQSHEWMHKNVEIQELKDLFDEKFNEEMVKAKTAFLESGGNDIDFSFKPEYKNTIESLAYEYRKTRRKYYKDLEASQKANLEKKQGIIEEIKELINVDDNINSIYRRFRTLQESWHNGGPVPRADSQNLWQTYKHHVERFYDFLHLNRDLRDLDFKHNYEEKLKIIERAEALIDLQDVIKANRDLNMLHRLWKDDLGPVAPEHRENLWKRFQEATKIIHKKKQEYQKNIESIFKANLEKKKNILNEMESLTVNYPKDHKGWQNAMKRFNELREAFKEVGNVTSNDSKATWKSFREVGRTFTHEKNNFYKKQKAEHKENINQKKALIREIDEILEHDNWDTMSNQVKQLQSRWKKVGFVPRKIDNQLWSEFQSKNNLFFERIKSGYQKMNAHEESVYNEKLTFIKNMKTADLPDEVEAYLTFVKEKWEAWQKMGDLNPSLENKINEVLLKAFSEGVKKSAIPAKDKEAVQFECNLIVRGNNGDRLQEEMQELKSKISTVGAEITQLENNLQFFSNSSSENPLIKEVHSKITGLEKIKEKLNNRLIKLKRAKKQLAKKDQEVESSPSEE